MIFKTFNNNIGKSIAKIGIFNKSFWAMQQDFKHENGLAFSIFGGQSVTNNDRQAILDLNTQLQNGVKPAKAWATTMDKCSISAQEQARQCLKSKGSLSELANGLNTTTLSIKAAEIGLKALSIAGNMLLMWGISEIIKLTAKGLKELNDTCLDTENKFSNLSDKYSDNKSKLKEINDKLSENEKKIKNILNLDNPTYADKQDLKNLREENILLKRKEDILKRTQKSTAKEAINTLEKRFENEFVTNDKKLEDATRLDSGWDYVKNVFTLGGYNVYQSAKYSNQSSDYENMLSSLSVLEEIEEKGGDLSQDKVTISDKKYGKITYNVKSIKDELEGYYGTLSSYIEEIQEFDPDLESEQAQYWISLQDQMYKFLNPEQWTADSVESVIQNENFSNISDKIKEEFSNGLIKNENDILNDTDAEKLVKSVAFKLYNKTDNESLKNAASNIIKYFRDSLVLSADELNQTISFQDAFNAPDFSSSKEKLLELSAAGKLTPETLSSTEEYKSLLDKTRLGAEECIERINDLVSAQDKLANVTNGLSSITNLYRQANENGFVDIKDLTSLDDTWKNLSSYEEFANIVGSGTHSIEEMQQAFNKLTSDYIKHTNVLDKVNESNKDLFINQLKSAGISNAQALVDEALSLKENWIAKAKENNIKTTHNLQNATYEEISALKDETGQLDETEEKLYAYWMEKNAVNNISIMTDTDINNLIGLISASDKSCESLKKLYKAKSNLASLYELYENGSISTDAYNNAVDTNTRILNGEDIKDDTTGKTFNSKIISTEAQNEISAYYSENFVSPDYNGGDNYGENAAKETEKSKEIFDWIETKINRLKTVISELGETASNTFKSLAERASAYGNEISKITEEIQLQKDAYSKYMEKANSVGLSEEWASKIRDGSLDISEITDDTLKTQIKDYQNWYDKAQDCLNTVNDLEQELAQLNIDRLQLSIDKASKNLDKFKSSSDRIQDKIDNDSRRTKVSDYNSLNKSYRNQIAAYEEQNMLLREQQQYVDKDSEKWAELETEIRNNNDAINDLKQNIKDNQNLKIQIRIDVKADELENLEKYGSKISDKISLRETSGQTVKASDYSRLNANAGKQIQNLQAQNRLIRQQQKNVENGSEAWNNYQDTIDSNNSSIRNLTKEMVENAKAMAALNNEAANKKIENINSSDELLDAKSAGTSSYKTKNSYINNKSANIDKRQKAYDGAVSSNKTKLNSAKKAINTIKSNSKNKGILKKIKSYVKSGKEIPVELIQSANSIDTNLAQKCAEYNAYLMELETSKTNAELYKYTSKQEKTELAKEKQSNIESYYSDRQSVYSQRATQLNSRIDLSQSKGYQISTKYYDKLIKNEEKNNASLTEEREKLAKTLDNSVKNGSIKKYSPEWYELCGQIDEVTNAINDSTKSLVEYKNQLRQVKWDNFDYLEERISSIISESDFMINQLSRKDLTSNDTGGLTDEGKAVASLRLANYTAYKQQSYDYKREIDKIDKDLAKDPYNKELINRKEELIKLYQESINAANDEKDSVIDLYTQGYDALKNKIGEVISEYEELLDKEKNAYDYQNTIADKTKQIASIRKQLAAYSKDTSEETKAKIQKLTVSLEEAEKDLKDTQYDRFISDTKDILGDLQDTLSDEIDNIISNMYDDFDGLSKDIKSYSDNAAQTITDEMKGIGYTPAEEFTTILNSSDFSTGMKEAIRDIKDFCKEMGAFANEQVRKEDLAKALEDTSQKEKDKDAAKTELDKAKEKKDKAELEKNAKYYRYKNAQIKYGDNSTYANMAKAEYDASNLKYEESNSEYKKLKQKYSKANAEYKSAKAYSDVMNYLDKHLGSTKTSREKLSDLNKVFYDRYDGKVLSKNEIEQLAGILNVKASSDKNGSLYKTLKNMGIPGFKNGSYNISGDHLALVAEEGQEIQFDKSQGVLRTVGQGDMIFTNEMAENLWKLAQNTPIPFNTNAFNTAPLPEFNSNFNGGDVNINMGGIVMNGVNDPEEFSKELNRHLATNPKTIKILQNQSVGSLSRNYNSLGSRKYL